MHGRIIYATTRFSGASTVGTEAAGQTVISLDNTRDFGLDAGFVYVGESVVPYTSVDRVNNTITLSNPLASSLPNGSLLMNYPYAVQRWALVAPDGNAHSPIDAVWCVIPHALAGFIAADGQRPEDDQERVRFSEQSNRQFMIDDVIDRQPWLDPFVIPDGAITETKIEPGSITTPLLAANAVATPNLQAGAVKAINIDVDALNGKTITGALIRSAATGRRVEMSSEGLVQFDTDGSVLISLGEQNKFTGEIDATSMIIRDSLQLFGTNNLFATGSKVTLKATTGSPSVAPSISWDYEEGPDITQGPYWYPTGVHSVNGVFHSGTYVFLHLGFYARSDGKYWNFPLITVETGEQVSEFKPWSMVRIAKADNGAERVVMIGEDQNHRNGGFPETWVRIYDDSTMNTSGTGAPVLKAQWKMFDFSWFREYRLGKDVNGSTTNRHKFIVATSELSESNPHTLKWWEFEYANADNAATQVWYEDLGPVIPNNASLAGCATGTRSGLKLDTTSGGAGSDWMTVFHTTTENIVRNNLTSTWETNSNWPTTWNDQDRAWIDHNPVTGVMNHYYSWNWGAGSDNVHTYRYANNHKRTSTNIWTSYAWRGEASTAYKTTESPRASIGYRRNARLRVTMPALPAPVAGVGSARNPAVDVYGWIYYVAHGLTDPATIHEGPTNPALAPNTPLAISVAALETFPTNSGTQPNLSNTFPASAPAAIVSDNGALQIDGDGDILARDVLADSIESEGNVTAQGQLWTGGKRIYADPVLSMASGMWTPNYASMSPTSGVYAALYGTSGPHTAPTGTRWARINFKGCASVGAVGIAGYWRCEAALSGSGPWSNFGTVREYNYGYQMTFSLNQSYGFNIAATQNLYIRIMGTSDPGSGAAWFFGDGAWSVEWMG